VASGFSAVQGAMGLFGSESEAVEKTLLKVQSAMALSQGLQALGESMDSFKQLKAVAVNAMNAIKTAIGSTGIGLLVIALGTIYTYWDDIKEAVSGVSEEQRKLNALTHQNFETSKEELKTLNNQDNILKLQGKSETEILKLKIKKLDTTIKDGEINLQNVINTSAAEEKAAIENYKRTQQLLDLVVNFSYFLPKLVLTPIDLAIKGANKVSEILGIGKAISFDIMGTINEMQDKATSFISKQLFDPEQVKKDGEKTRKELQDQLVQLRNQRAGIEIEITNIENDEADKRKKKKDDEAENDKKRFEKELEERQKRLARIQELEQQNFNALNQKQKDFTATS
jgi:PAS domain-containing protein